MTKTIDNIIELAELEKTEVTREGDKFILKGGIVDELEKLLQQSCSICINNKDCKHEDYSKDGDGWCEHFKNRE